MLAAVIAGLAFACVKAFAKKKKFAIFTLLVAIPAVTSLVYVILGLTKTLDWNPGWLMIVGSVFVDFVILLLRVIGSSKKEVEDEIWEDD